MATNPPGKGKKVVGTSIPLELYDIIAARASEIGLTPSAYTRGILEKWYHEGNGSVFPGEQPPHQVAEDRDSFPREKP